VVDRGCAAASRHWDPGCLLDPDQFPSVAGACIPLRW
jgi:hypothetical protein